MVINNTTVINNNGPRGFGPNGQPPCPTSDPLRLFLMPDPAIGGPIPSGDDWPLNPGQPSELVHIAINALLGRTARLVLSGKPRWRRGLVLRGLEALPIGVDWA